jgi:hypothetical protein
MPFYTARNLCPNCARPMRKDDAECQGCGQAFERRQPVKGPPSPADVSRQRSWQVIGLAAVSLLSVPFTGAMLSCAGYLGTTLPGAIPYLVLGLGFLVCGQFAGTAAVVFAFRDWLGMRTGWIDRRGLGRTVVGGVMAGVAVLLYWWMIGTVIVSLF